MDGLRIDVAHAVSKAEGVPDSPSEGGVVDGLRSNPQVSDQKEVHEVYRRWRVLAEQYEPHRLLVGEVNLEPARAARYTRSDEMQQAFASAFVKHGGDPDAWAAVCNDIEAARLVHGATPTWALENHDSVRTVTRFGGGEPGASRARAALVRRTSTRARSSGCPRSTCRWRPGWIPCGRAAESAATVPACRCPGGPTPGRTKASR